MTRIAELVDLPKGTVSRFLSALEKEGAVDRSVDNDFTIGPAITDLSRPSTFEASLVMRARSAILRLPGALERR